jgi:hypothetical protein
LSKLHQLPTSFREALPSLIFTKKENFIMEDNSEAFSLALTARLKAGLKRSKRNRIFWDNLMSEMEKEDIVEREKEKNKVAFRRREVYPRESYTSSFWYLFMQRNLSNLNSRDGKNFRLRFTVPYPVFQQLLVYAEARFHRNLTTFVEEKLLLHF